MGGGVVGGAASLKQIWEDGKCVHVHGRAGELMVQVKLHWCRPPAER